MASTVTMSEQEIERLSVEAMSWCLAHGLVMGTKDSPTMVQHCPVSLIPTRVPRASFARAKMLAPLFNKMVDAAARDFEWLEATLEDAARADADFTGKLLEIARKVAKEGLAQNLMLALNRSDYMLHAPNDAAATAPGLLQVELNTIAASFGALSSLTGRLQEFLLNRFAGAEVPGGVPGLWAHVTTRVDGGGAAATAADSAGDASATVYSASAGPRLELSQPVKELPVAIAKAVALYGGSSETSAAGCVVIFVVQAGDTNSTDQRLLEYELFAQCGAPVVRLTLEEVSKRCTVDEVRGRALFLDAKHEVAVVYFRAGYTPNDYPSEVQWESRLLLERSRAIKCPSVFYHLFGAKKVQQQLCQPGEVERFVSPADAKQLRACFAGQCVPQRAGAGATEEVATMIASARTSPELFVLKPQREGGGNNIWGDDIAAALSEDSSMKGYKTDEELLGYVLMERIMPPFHPGVFMRGGEVMRGKATSEIGVFGTFLGDGKNELHNEYGGYILRSKLEGVDEGGVAAGYAHMDVALLV